MNDFSSELAAWVKSELEVKDKEIERLTALYDQMVRVNGNMKVENDRLEAKVAKLETALRGYVKATTGQESATVTFPMALEGEVK